MGSFLAIESKGTVLTSKGVQPAYPSQHNIGNPLPCQLRTNA